jgi:hypothetical protein
MKKLIVLPLIAATALGLSACTKHETTENVSVNATDVNATDTSALDANAAGAVDNGSNASEALTNG